MKKSFIILFTIISPLVFSQKIIIDTLYYQKSNLIREIKTKYKDSTVFVKFHENGHKSREYSENNEGLFIGVFQNWYPNGSVQSYAKYTKKGKKTGATYSFYKNGLIEKRCFYNKGEGICSYFNHKGILTSKIFEKTDGSFIIEAYCKNGTLITTRFSTNEPYNFVNYYCNGNKYFKGRIYENGYYIGLFEKWYKNGNLQEKGEYLDWSKIEDKKYKSIKIGTWKYYNKKGRLEKEEIYNNDGKLIKTKEY